MQLIDTSAGKMCDDSVYIRKVWLDKGVADTLADVKDVQLVLSRPCKYFLSFRGIVNDNNVCYFFCRPRPEISKLDVIRLNLAAKVIGADSVDSIFNVAENTFDKGSTTTK